MHRATSAIYRLSCAGRRIARLLRCATDRPLSSIPHRPSTHSPLSCRLLLWTVTKAHTKSASLLFLRLSDEVMSKHLPTRLGAARKLAGK
eukprot:1181975-Prorocentrum_minimum.AAC.3